LVANRERTRFTRALLDQLPDLRIIAQTGNHVYHIDFDAIDERGIIVAKATGGGCTGAAELAIGLMIALMRRIPTVDRALKVGEWPTPMTHVLRAKTLGIVGLGYVGRHVAKIANAFEMRVLAWGPRLSADAAAAVGAEVSDLDTLMRASDIVSIHATLGAESRGLIDTRRLGLMKPSAYLINTARQKLVDEAALTDAILQGRIAGAAIDDPLEDKNSPLLGLPNFVCTPHIGNRAIEGVEAVCKCAYENAMAVVRGDWPRFILNPQVYEREGLRAPRPDTIGGQNED
jgi:phosphoglycerate dehydrogenase-like enzyme